MQQHENKNKKIAHTIAHLHVLRASDPFLQCKMQYISYIGVVNIKGKPGKVN